MLYSIIIIFIILVLILRLPSKGEIGERAVNLLLRELNEDQYFVLHDLYLPKSDGKTTQIDHVVVSIYGIFVVETKNFKGWIMGGESNQYWTQIIYKKRKNFYNPIKQNQSHIKVLKETLYVFPELPFISIVAFSTRAKLKINVTSQVIYIPQILRTIEKYDEQIILPEDARQICEIISKANIEDKEARKAHVIKIRENLDDKNNKIRRGECPVCGNALVKRNGKYGSFTGCSNYPKCRFTAK